MNATPERDRLTVQLEGNVVQTLDLVMPVLTIGRAPDNTLPLPHPMISRRHAELAMSSEGPVLTDLGSANGTLVGQTRLRPQQPHLLAHGAMFQIGPYLFTYYAAARPAPLGIETPLPEPPPIAAAPLTETPLPDQPANGTPEQAAVPVLPAAPAVTPWPAAEGARLPAPPAKPPRATFPAPVAMGQMSSYLQHLPIIFQDNDFLSRYLMILESIWEPLEQRQDHIAAYFDPATCPATFLPWLVSWVDPSLATHWPEARVRTLLAEAMDLYRWRGTRYGVARMIEVCTGLTPQIVEDPATPFVFSVRLTVPAGASLDRRLIEGLIQAQKPAHAGYVLEMVTAP
jgi:phage tail-like protein